MMNEEASTLCYRCADLRKYTHLLEERLRSVLGSRNHPGWLSPSEKEWYRDLGGDPL